ncbi:MAG: hypothetical protein B0A82_08800, partial [Alkalinema sp. CACIAM 70d]
PLANRGHDHAHIVASRIRLDGTTVSDSWDYRRSEAVIRQLEQEYGLRSLHSSQEKDCRSSTTGEQRLLARTGEESVRVQLQRSLDQITRYSLTMPQLIEQLQQQGINVRVSNQQTDQIKGISYELKGIAFSGTHLGKAYTFTGLQKYRGVDYESCRDNESIKKLIEKSISSSAEIRIETKSFTQILNTENSRKSKNESKNEQESKILKNCPRELEL